MNERSRLDDWDDEEDTLVFRVGVGPVPSADGDGDRETLVVEDYGDLIALANANANANARNSR